MNKLYEERRFDDIIHVYNKARSFEKERHKLEQTELLLDALIEKVNNLLNIVKYALFVSGISSRN
jgi:hypothetical protein